MKKFFSIMTVALVALSLTQLTSCKKQQSQDEVTTTTCEETCKAEKLPIALVDLELLSENYHYAQDKREIILKRGNSLDATLKAKENSFSKGYEEHQRKIQTNSYMSLDRAKQVEADLNKQYEDLQALSAKYSQELQQAQIDLIAALSDSVDSYLKEINADGKYQMILNKQVVLNIVDGYDITDEVVEALNARYDASKVTK